MSLSRIDSNSIAAGAIVANDLANGSITSAKLAVSGVAVGSYGNTTSIPTFTVGVDGRITAASNVEIAISATPFSDNTALAQVQAITLSF